MTTWVRFQVAGIKSFGTLKDDIITIYEGDMFNNPSPTRYQIALSEVQLIIPCEPSKMLGLWNNFHALATKLESAIPDNPLYFQKSSNSYLATGGVIKRPSNYTGRVVFEGELGIVIGKTCKDVTIEQAPEYIFGYTCINDVTGFDVLHKDPTFAQWGRAKSFDTFGPFGPCIATDLEPENLNIVTVLNGDERQNYPVSDMIIPPYKIISMLSCEITLSPGDIICCGTSVGAGSMKEPHNTISVTIEGVGTLQNTFDNL